MNHEQTTVLAEGRGPRGRTCMMFTKKKKQKKNQGKREREKKLQIFITLDGHLRFPSDYSYIKWDSKETSELNCFHKQI